METDPRGTSETDLRQMEIHVHLGGEESGNNLEGTVSLHTIRTETNSSRPNQ